MRKGSKGQKRRADILKLVAEMDAEDFPPDDGKDKAAQSLGRRGGKARAKVLTAQERSAIARKAALGRWANKR